ncbi:DUF2087 domain-containing protein [Bifidobacterium amazonense]|uniref:DUF2087 domain-containing protein n=1 Tax=Bifidobacterium amazonense TaxID=2809027 RepID=A0ABS9VWI4_9BIFI|nr:DUF2087 domain-containing protein [Bifidobacterium amazonense]MCH9276483.1 DUF2087 domain-containing protein [Bifidobacterium amazonense]
MDKNAEQTLRECRMLLSMLRTPKLRDDLAKVLAGDPSGVTGPLKQLGWLSDDAEFSVAGLAEAQERLKDLMSDQGILLMDRVHSFPQAEDEREAMLRAIGGRVFENMGARSWLTEAELTARLSMMVDDAAEIRRYLIDRGLIRRAEDGSRYWLGDAEPTA